MRNMNRDRQEADRRQLLTCEQSMLELTPTDAIVKTYLKDLHDLKRHLVTHEPGLKSPFQTPLDKAA
jgi:hypothetical protein